MRKIKNIKVLIACVIVLTAVIGIVAHWISKAPQRALEKQIEAMIGMQINLNFEVATAFYYGKDSLFVSTPINKMIIYVDSASCSTCFLNRMIDYYEVNDSLQNHGNSLVVVLYPSHEMRHEILSRLKLEQFPFWSILDEEGEFLRHNRNIPENRLLHAFLVDQKDKIIMVGDPVRNKRIMNLLNKIICNDITN